MPTLEARREQANRITVEAIRIASRDGRTAAERARIYDREIERPIGPPPTAPPEPRAGFLFRF